MTMNKEQVEMIELEISDNVHPNIDGSPWGWLVLKGTRIRVATYSGREEKQYCKKIIEAIAGRIKSMEREKELEEGLRKISENCNFFSDGRKFDGNHKEALKFISKIAQQLLNNKH